MNIREARKLKPGAIVRQSWATKSKSNGLVLAVNYERGEKTEAILGQKKPERYMVTVNWFEDTADPLWAPKGIKRHSSWDLMVISHVD
tara:strand:- start:597 stop:860 length:264 start_codon:yes stop_codon:yes gene_type:complete